MSERYGLTATAGLLALCLLAACGGAGGGEPAPEPGGESEAAMEFQIMSAAFDEGAPIPTRHTGEGPDVSPPLEWSGAPEDTREFALICDDPDAPTAKPWVHWVLYGIAAEKTSLAEDDRGGGIEGRNDFGRPDYGGPMPPRGHGTHRYFFKLYALDAPLTLKAGATKEQLLEAMEGHVLATAQTVGTYERK